MFFHGIYWKNEVSQKETRSYEVFRVQSWTIEEYLLAIKDDVFYQSVEKNLDAEQVLLGDGEAGSVAVAKEKEQALISKFYYAGGSCRYMFQYPTKCLIEEFATALESVANKKDLIELSSGMHHSNDVNRLYGMTRRGGRVAVSSYVTYLFAKQAGPTVIAELANRLNRESNPSVSGFIFEWLFFASVRQKQLVLFDVRQETVTLPQAEVMKYNPKRKFTEQIDPVLNTWFIVESNFWLQPVWNQGGYDAVYIDFDKNTVIFIQLTTSHQHDLKVQFFCQVLVNLTATNDRMTTRSSKTSTDWKVEIYFIVKKVM